MKKNWFRFLCLCLALLVPAAAMAAARMPAMRGVVTDDADVLGAQTAADIAAYAEMVEDGTDIRLHVALVHFLDGLDAQTYADQLFTKWELGEDDMLVVGAAGEDSFATAMDKDVQQLLGKSNAENLMYTSSAFSSLFRSQQYDAAFCAYFQAMNTLIGKQTGESIRLGSLFGTVETAQEPVSQNFGSKLWAEVMENIYDTSESHQEYQEVHRQQENGMTAGEWLVLLVLIGIVFSQSGPARKARRNREFRRYGCGCSPLGWIFSLFGINVLIDALRGRRR